MTGGDLGFRYGLREKNRVWNWSFDVARAALTFRLCHSDVFVC
jgi:hypothetical protein